jgi:uncharacterized membrane protein YbhN (UPF0104 family)
VWTLRAVVLALVCFGVSGTVRHAWDLLSQYDWRVRPGWLIASSVLYAAGLTPLAWFWYRSLASLGQPAPWWATLRAYFLGHLGKYVPGKALTVVLRVAGVRKWVQSLRVAVVSVLLETLTMMSVGAFLAAALSTVALQLEPRHAALIALVAVAAGLPTLPPVARRLARLGMNRLQQEDELHLPPTIPADVDASIHGINLKLLISGWLAACVCWMMFGLSLWAALRAIGAAIHPISGLPLLTAAVAFAVVAGFLSQLPGGLGVRDGVLMQLLATVCDDADALVAALLLRLIWLVTEVAV